MMEVKGVRRFDMKETNAPESRPSCRSCSSDYEKRKLCSSSYSYLASSR